MFDRDILKNRFDAAGIALRFARGPVDFGVRPQRGIFLMDVRRVRGGASAEDEFVLAYGDEAVDAHVVHVDSGLRQLILEVVEPERRVTASRWDRSRRAYVDEEQVTAASVRRLLVGHDEAHLFVCTLGANASSVREAHRKLAPSVFQRERRRRSPHIGSP